VDLSRIVMRWLRARRGKEIRAVLIGDKSGVAAQNEEPAR
jgi:hypothetical protein